MNNLFDNLENEPEADNDGDFEIKVSEAQQLRPENCSGPLRLTIRDVTKKYFTFGERDVVWFREIGEYLLPWDSQISILSREIGSKRRYDWRGVEVELTPRSYTDKRSGEKKHSFGVRVIKGPIPEPKKAEAPQPQANSETSPANNGAAVALNDEVPFAKC